MGQLLQNVCLFLYAFYGGIVMIENIFVGIMFIIAVTAGIWGWWIENGSSSSKDKKEDQNRKDLEQ